VKVKITPSKVWGEVSAPPSKSYTHRALIVAALAAGTSLIADPLLADDTRYTIDAGRALGAGVEVRDDGLAVRGTGGIIKPRQTKIYVGNSGSTIRMIAPLVALGNTKVILDGDNRLRQRPMGELLAALNSLGIEARSLNNNGCPPLEIEGGEFKAREIALSAELSSQHLSGLLMAAPVTKEGLTIKVEGGLRSRPYIDITLDVMQAFGVEAVNRGYKEFVVKGSQAYKARNYRIEGDYSSAACFLAAGAIGGGPLTVRNLRKGSVQGDRHLLDILSQMGADIVYQEDSVTVSRQRALKGVSIDASDYPDLVPTLAVVAAFARGRTELSNIGHLRFKESDRIEDTAAELAKMKVKTEVGEDGLVIHGGRPLGAGVEAHSDHRLAMSLSLAALFTAGISTINGAEAVTKSYPRFFDDLKKLGAEAEVVP